MFSLREFSSHYRPALKILGN